MATNVTSQSSSAVEAPKSSIEMSPQVKIFRSKHSKQLEV